MEDFQIEAAAMTHKLLRELVGIGMHGIGLLAQIAEGVKKPKKGPAKGTSPPAQRPVETKGPIEIPEGGVLHEKLTQRMVNRVFGPVRDQWAAVLNEEFQKDRPLKQASVRAAELVQQFAKQWNECFPFRAATKTANYHRLLVRAPRDRIRLTQSELFGCRKTVPTTKKAISRLVGALVWKWGATYLNVAMEMVPFEPKPRTYGQHVRWNLALLCGPALEIQVLKHEWNPEIAAEYDCAVFAKQLSQVWPNLMTLIRSFEAGLSE